MIDDSNGGRTIFYDFHTAAEKRADPSLENTGLFFFRTRSVSATGFGTGTGTRAEGWITDAVRFWAKQMSDRLKQ